MVGVVVGVGVVVRVRVAVRVAVGVAVGVVVALMFGTKKFKKLFVAGDPFLFVMLPSSRSCLQQTNFDRELNNSMLRWSRSH